MGSVCGLRTATWFSHSSAMSTATGSRSLLSSSGTPPGVLSVRLSSMTAYCPALVHHSASASRSPLLAERLTVGLLLQRDRLPEPAHHLLRTCRSHESVSGRSRAEDSRDGREVCGSAFSAVGAGAVATERAQRAVRGETTRVRTARRNMVQR